ncbi:MAG: DNA polymerase III subunit gamma/tau [Pseudomonadales bacterium]|nr:DNA polymerase III subunit gamma/tau [Pseudomonadales bacterium]
MSYQVLARKWRPTNFSKVAGQAHVLKSLQNALDNERLHHAYLFIGTRGVGKTTLARILAKCLNCERGVSSTPCEECNSCVEINEGRFIDLIEVDAASRTKVEDTRELLDNVQYAPARGRFKVYLIDEVHMLSNHSFNALLKTLEEPPPHVKFLFATTDPKKLPVTVLSRCLQFNLKNLSPQLIVGYLAQVLTDEKIEFDEDALWQVAVAASGSMRDALTLIDQAISYCQGKIQREGVVEMLGVPEQQQVYALLEVMAKKDAGEMINLVNLMAEKTPDFMHTLDSFLSLLHRVAIAQVLPKAIDNSYGDREQIEELASKFTGEDIQLYYQLGVKGRDDLTFTADTKSAFEMILLRMLVFSPEYVDTAQKLQLDEPGARGTANGIKKKNLDLAHESEPSPAKAAFEKHVEALPSKNPTHREQHGAAETPKQADKNFNGLNNEGWLRDYSDLVVDGIAANVLANSQLNKIEGDTLHFLLDTKHSSVFNKELIPKLSRAVSDLYKRELNVIITIGELTKETPAELSQRQKQELHKKMVSEFEGDKNVQELLRHFTGTVVEETIAPTNESGKS